MFVYLLQPLVSIRWRVRRNRSENVDSTQIGDSGRDLQMQDDSEGVDKLSMLDFPLDIQGLILSKLALGDLFRGKVISKQFNDYINSEDFSTFRGVIKPTEYSLTAIHPTDSQEHVQLEGFDLDSMSWVRLPPLRSTLPSPDPELSKGFLICGAGGIMCVNVFTSSTNGRMTVFNPLTGRCKELPPFHHPRNPVLMQMVVDSAGGMYKIIVAGSARAGHSDPLSKITEVFDSGTGIWTITEDLPGLLVASNDHQTGAYMNGILYCIALLGSGIPGVLAFNVNEGKWLPHLSCPLPITTNLTTVQLVESDLKAIVLFSEIERAYMYTEHRIDILEEVVTCTNLGAANLAQGKGNWRNVVTVMKARSPDIGLPFPPTFTCVPFGKEKVCIFDTIVHTGVVYDVQTGNRIQDLPSPIWSKSRGKGCFRMNPLTFSFQPSFKGNPNDLFTSRNFGVKPREMGSSQ